MFKKLSNPILANIKLRSLFTLPPTANNILLYGKEKDYEASINNLVVDENADCYKCYQLMTTNHVNYLKVIRDDIIIGTLKKSDVKELMLYHQYEQEENEQMLDDFRKTQQ
jgi:hypothetical protein